jgi:hypothetical protein
MSAFEEFIKVTGADEQTGNLSTNLSKSFY